MSDKAQSMTVASTAIFAHRGNRVAAPENTLAAFRAVAATGADGVEFDVQLSADGKPVVIHDETLARTTDGAGAVRDHSLAALRALDAGRWFGDAFVGERIPTLAEVLDVFRDGEQILNVELKTSIEPYPGLVRAALAEVRNAALEARVVLSSFNHYTLLDAAWLAPDMPRAALFSDVLIAPWDYARHHGFSAVHPERHGCEAKLIRSCHEAGLAVRTYTVNDPREAERLMALGVDGIFTDDPAALMPLARRHRERN